MRFALSSLLTLAWGLWFGGSVMLFMLVSSVFNTLSPARTAADNAVAGSVTAPMFHIFERYQLVLAAIAVGATIGLRLMSCSRAKKLLLALLLLASLVAVVQTAFVSSRMEDLRQAREGSGPAFRRLHGISMASYSGNTLVLLGIGLLLPRVLREDAEYVAPPERSRATSAAGPDGSGDIPVPSSTTVSR